jgi:hypothetical protein
MGTGVLIFALFALIVVGIVSAIAYNIPWPPALAWARWAIPCVALLVALILILQRAGPV